MSKFTAQNGLNFNRSIGNQDSRLEMVRDYLTVCGPATKREILRDVFDKKVSPDGVTKDWGSTLFQTAVHHGLFSKVRRGNRVFWSIPMDTRVHHSLRGV